MDTDAVPRFQMVPSSGSRYVSLHDGAGMTVASLNPGVCTITEIRESQLPADDRATGGNAATHTDRFFRLDGKSKGGAFITAISSSTLPTFLEVGVKDKLTQRVKFYSLRDAGNQSRRPLAVVGQWLPQLNYIWKRQANVEFVRLGAPENKTLTQNLGNPIMLGTTGFGANGDIIANSGDASSDLNVFFVWEIQRPGSGNDTDATTRVIGSAHSGGGPGVVLFEDDAGSGEMLSMAHEIGHHMGLSHNEGKRENLMWPFSGERGLNITKAEVNIANP
jgi:hypothetical protein